MHIFTNVYMDIYIYIYIYIILFLFFYCVFFCCVFVVLLLLLTHAETRVTNLVLRLGPGLVATLALALIHYFFIKKTCHAKKEEVAPGLQTKSEKKH